MKGGAQVKTHGGAQRARHDSSSQVRQRRSPLVASPQPIERLQSTAGNRALHALLSSEGGTPLPAAVRAEMGSRFGHDFSSVRIHTSDPASESATAIGANALTRGNSIVFGQGHFAPDTNAGKRLLAHELAHVVQQSRGGQAPPLDRGAAHEGAARSAADAVVGSTAPVAVQGATGVGVAADWGDWALAKVKKGAKTALLGPVGSAVYDVVTSDKDPVEATKEVVRDKMNEAVGEMQGTVSQVTGLADNLIWAGNELRDLKNEGVTAIANTVGIDPETAKKVARWAPVALGPMGGTFLTVDALGDASDQMKESGLKDERGQASLTVPFMEATNAVADKAEDLIGAEKEEDPFIFTTRERAELEGAIKTQALGALVGATEVKIALSAVALIGGVRQIVETVRDNPNDFYKKPAFYSGILSSALSLVGLKGSVGAGKRVIDIIVNTGQLLEVVPYGVQLYQTFYHPSPEMLADPKKHEDAVKRDLGALIKAVAGVIISVLKHGTSGKSFKGKNAPADEPDLGPSKAQKKADKVAAAAESDSTKKAKAAENAEAEAKRLQSDAEKLADAAKAKRDAANEQARKLAEKSEAAKATGKAYDEAQQQLEIAKAAGDAKAQKKAESAVKKTKDQADKATRAVARKQNPVKTESEKADRADARATKKQTDAAEARKKAVQAKKQAEDAVKAAARARQKAEALKPPPDPQTKFDEPEFAPDPNAKVKVSNEEPVVWVSTERGKTRGTYVPEGHAKFGKGEGVAMPKTEAEQVFGARPQGTDATPPTIKPITIGGTQRESNSAGGNTASNVRATARDPKAIKVTAIKPDVHESAAYNHHIHNQGEFGLLRPQGSNVKGVDSITARVEFDSKGRPVRAKIFLNDVTTPDQVKTAKPSHADWHNELAKAVNTDPAKGPVMDFGDPAVNKVIADAAANGNVEVRVVRVSTTATGQSITIDTNNTPVILPRPIITEDKDDEEEKEDQR